ncbi:MAG: flippase-like domain-containing protein [Bacteroidales bacterium]|nr:flippase-like domain-containing protein [Bacteroidales bacterium]
MRKAKVYKTLNILLRLIIVAASLGFIYWKLLGKGDLGSLLKSIGRFGEDTSFYAWIIAVSVLMLVNWSIESLKWKLLVHRITRISFLRALQSVIAGVTVSIFTPNRTGEFIGRAFILKGNHQGKAVVLTIVGSISQLMVTMVIGSLAGCLLFNKILPANVIVPVWAYWGIIAGVIFADTIILMAFFRMPWLKNFFRKTFEVRFPRLFEYVKVVGSITRRELLNILVLSFSRYLIFSLQFYMILAAFGIFLPVSEGLLVISIIFMALAIIPTFALSELGVRGSVSLYILGAYQMNTNMLIIGPEESLAIVLAAGSLWIINLAIPALAGIPFVFKLRFFGK